MTTTAHWTKMQHFFSTPSKFCGVPNELERYKAYEDAESNVERLEILFHLPIVQVHQRTFNFLEYNCFCFVIVY